MAPAVPLEGSKEDILAGTLWSTMSGAGSDRPRQGVAQSQLSAPDMKGMAVALLPDIHSSRFLLSIHKHGSNRRYSLCSIPSCAHHPALLAFAWV